MIDDRPPPVWPFPTYKGKPLPPARAPAPQPQQEKRHGS